MSPVADPIGEAHATQKESVMATVKPRQTGASAVVAPTGQAVVTSATGGEITLNRAATDPAFSPLDLLYAAIAGCLVVGIFDAATRAALIAEAEETCTVSNTIRTTPEFVTVER